MAEKKKQAVSPINGQPVPKGKPFTTSDPRAKEAQRKSAQVQKEKADLKAACRIWMETEVAKDKNGNPLTGQQFMVASAAKGIKEGNSKFWELMRDTAGFKPVDKVMVADVDPSVISAVERMVLEDDAENEA